MQKETEMPVLEALSLAPEQEPEAKKVRKPSSGPRARILSISPAPRDHTDLSRIADERVWQVASAHTFREAVAYLSRADAFVIFCENSLPDGTWKQLLEHAARLPVPPPVIVTSRLADDHLWAEVLNLGGFDVLAKPFNEREVRHVLDSAWMQRVNPVGNARVAGI
jgi:DNA-binding response OmpR family regulator